ncbi:MAG: NADH-quinone oxidoreductase subunit NuoG [Acidimicrobiia bacterium]|jgi:NADH-quinone oxidoreductase subunit G
MDAVPMSQWPSDQKYVIPVAPGPDVVTVTIDGKEVRVPRGELLIEVAQEHGTYIPRFCWHERMKPVGMCRMCLVEIEGMRGLQISCATPVTDGMVVSTQSPGVKAAQDGVLEFLLVNHPLDCPVCDRGGECPLQDQTLAFGPGESRFVEEKRHFEKPIAISDTVLLDRERCIQCGRCTRFAAEIAGDALIDFGGRGSSTEVITFPDQPFDSYFAGNTVQICPVGALTASPYRFRARPWDLDSVETSCQQCAVGCRGALESTSNRLVRLLGVDLDPVNQGWLCDRGRYGYEWVHSDARATSPLVRRGGALAEANWPQALDAAADALRAALDAGGPEAIGVLGGARGTNEDAYTWARFAKGVLATDNVDAQLGDGLPAEVVLGVHRATIDDLDGAAAIVVIAPDLKETLPVLYLRVRQAALERGVPLVDVAPRDNGLTPSASVVVRHLPGEVGAVGTKLASVLAGRSAQSPPLDDLLGLLEGRDGPVVVILGRPSLAEPVTAVVHAASELAALPNVRFLSALHRGNVHGALDLGLAPGFLPGRVTLAAGGAHVAEHWGTVPAAPGLDAAGILAAAAAGRIRTLVLVGADPLTDFPDRPLVEAALAKADDVIVVGAFAGDAGDHATVLLPVTVWGEQDGTASNLEGRVQRLARKVTPGGATMESWRVAGELALRFGTDFDLELVGEVQDEIARVAPAFAGVDAALLRRARDGVVVPLVDHAHEIVWGPAPLGAGVSWEPIPAGSDAELVPVAETEGDETSETGDTANSGAVPVPAVALHTWQGPADPAPVVPVDGYALRLVAARTLYGTDRAVQESPSLAQHAPVEPVLLVNRIDRDRIGVADGDRVRATSARGTVEIAVRADAATPQGTAFLASNRSGPGVGDLVDAGEAVTDLRVETLRRQERGS